MPLPKEGTKEWEKEVKFYLSATLDEIKERAKQCGMNYISYPRRMRERGIYKETGGIVEINDRPEVHLPP